MQNNFRYYTVCVPPGLRAFLVCVVDDNEGKRSKWQQQARHQTS